MLLVVAFIALGMLALGGALRHSSQTSRDANRAAALRDASAAAAAAVHSAAATISQDFHRKGHNELAQNQMRYEAMTPKKLALATTKAGSQTSDEIYEADDVSLEESLSMASTFEPFQFTDDAGRDGATTVNLIHRRGFAMVNSSQPGLYGYATTYRIRSQAKRKDALLPVSSTVEMDLQLADIPISQYGVLYAMDLEITPESSMAFNGRIHSNGRIYLNPNGGSLTFGDYVTSTREIKMEPNPKDAIQRSGGSVKFEKGQVEGTVAVGLALSGDNDPRKNHSIIDIPPDGESPTSRLGRQRFFHGADLIVEVHDSTVAFRRGSDPGAETPVFWTDLQHDAAVIPSPGEMSDATTKLIKAKDDLTAATDLGLASVIQMLERNIEGMEAAQRTAYRTKVVQEAAENAAATRAAAVNAAVEKREEAVADARAARSAEVAAANAAWARDKAAAKAEKKGSSSPVTFPKWSDYLKALAEFKDGEAKGIEKAIKAEEKAREDAADDERKAVMDAAKAEDGRADKIAQDLKHSIQKTEMAIKELLKSVRLKKNEKETLKDKVKSEEKAVDDIDKAIKELAKASSNGLDSALGAEFLSVFQEAQRVITAGLQGGLGSSGSGDVTQGAVEAVDGALAALSGGDSVVAKSRIRKSMNEVAMMVRAGGLDSEEAHQKILSLGEALTTIHGSFVDWKPAIPMQAELVRLLEGAVGSAADEAKVNLMKALNLAKAGLEELGSPLPDIEVVALNNEEVIQHVQDAVEYSDYDRIGGLTLVDGAGGINYMLNGNEIKSLKKTGLLIAKAVFYDKREGMMVESLDLNVRKLVENDYELYDFITSKLGRAVRTIYIVDKRTRPPGTILGVRILRGEKLPVFGLTVATEGPVYIHGDFNAPKIKNGRLRATADSLPAAIAGDSVTVLSSGWDDVNSLLSLNSRQARSVTINASIITGIVPTTANHYSGGLENALRLLEDWDGETLTFNGSLAVMFPSVYAISPWGGVDVYSPPKRVFTFDPNLKREANTPARMTQYRTVFRGEAHSDL